jgi:group I intron endonuclease
MKITISNMYIYRTTNNINKKVYVGKSEKPVFSTKYLGSGKLLWKAIAKYGKSNFTVELIDTAETIEELNEKEKYWINFYMENSYNLAEGGTGGWTTKHYGKAEMIEYRAKLSNSRRKWKLSESTKRKISAANKGKLRVDPAVTSNSIKKMWEDPASVYNTPEYREKLSEKAKQREWSDVTKEKIRQTKLGSLNGMSIKIKVDNIIFETRRSCALHFGISDTAVTKRCKSKNFPGWEILN